VKVVAKDWESKMSMSFNKMIICLVVFVPIANVGLAQASTPLPADSLPTPVVGEKITLTGGLSTVQCSTWQVVAINQDGMNVSECNGNKAYSLASNGGLVKVVSPDGTTLVGFSPSAVPLPFPLMVGKSWKGTYGAYTKFNSAEWKGAQSCEIPDYDTLNLQSGPIGAYKIVCQDNWSAGVVAGTSTITSWYSPQAKSIIKIVNDKFPIWDMEMVSFYNP
jgi:hypothetical protein